MLPKAALTTTPSREEIDFRRLLIRTEELLAQEGVNALCITPDSAKLATNLRTLRDTIQHWREVKDTRFDKAVLSEYVLSVQRLSRVIDDIKLVSPVDHALAQNRTMFLGHRQERDRLLDSVQELRLRRRAENLMKEALLQERQHPSNRITKGAKQQDTKSADSADQRRELLAGRNGGPGSGGRNDDLETVLQRDRAIHNELTEDMIRMAKVLKGNVAAFGDILHRDEQVLGDTQTAMLASVDRLSKEGVRLGVFRKRSSKTTVFTWTILLFVCITFVFAFMFIRLSPKQTRYPS